MSFPEIDPRLFSFNSPYGACPRVRRPRHADFFDPELLVPDPEPVARRRRDRAVGRGHASRYYPSMLRSLAAHSSSRSTRRGRSSRRARAQILTGSDEKVTFRFGRSRKWSFAPQLGRRRWACSTQRYHETDATSCARICAST